MQFWATYILNQIICKSDKKSAKFTSICLKSTFSVIVRYVFHGIFKEIDDKENVTLSAILKEKRPCIRISTIKTNQDYSWC
jgi:hypothetical protein